MIGKLLAILFVTAVAANDKPFAGVDPNTLSCDPLGQVFLLLPHHTDCSLFYICAHGQEVLQTCSSPLIFDFELQGCNWVWDAKCILRTPPGGESEEDDGGQGGSDEGSNGSEGDGSDGGGSEGDGGESGDNGSEGGESGGEGAGSDEGVGDSGESGDHSDEIDGGESGDNGGDEDGSDGVGDGDESGDHSEEIDGGESGDNGGDEDGSDGVGDGDESGDHSDEVDGGESGDNGGEWEIEGSGEGSGEESGDFESIIEPEEDGTLDDLLNLIDNMQEMPSAQEAVRPSVFGAFIDCSNAESAARIVAYKGDCQRFWRCVSGVPQTFYCTDGLYYNERTQMCDFEANVRCSTDLDDELQGEYIFYK